MNININGKKYNLFWSVGARLEYDEWIVSHQDSGTVSESIVRQAVAMSRAYNDANGIKDKDAVLTIEEIKRQPASFLDELSEVVRATIQGDSETTVETKPGKRKAAES